VRQFINIVESFTHGFQTTWRRGNSCEVFKNPSLKEYRQCLASNDDVRAFLVGDDILIWNTFEAVHQMVREEMKLDQNAIPINLYGHPGGECIAVITDNSRNSPWWHSGEVIEVIETNNYLKRNFTNIEIGFYDEDIVGPWGGLTESAIHAEPQLEQWVTIWIGSDGRVHIFHDVHHTDALKTLVPFDETEAFERGWIRAGVIVWQNSFVDPQTYLEFDEETANPEFVKGAVRIIGREFKKITGYPMTKMMIGNKWVTTQEFRQIYLEHGLNEGLVDSRAEAATLLVRRSMKMSPQGINNGWCMAFAIKLKRMLGPEAKMLDTTSMSHPVFPGHWVVLYRGKYYDAESPQGVSDPAELAYSRRLRAIADSEVEILTKI
jgi:hypothetical protein